MAPSHDGGKGNALAYAALHELTNGIDRLVPFYGSRDMDLICRKQFPKSC